MAILNIHSNLMIYGDSESVTSNPKRRYVDWTRHLAGQSVEDPLSQQFSVLPGQTLAIFSGTRTAPNVNNRYSIALKTGQTSVYRATKYSGASAIGFATDRAVSTDGLEATLTVNNNITVTLEVDSGSPFSSVQVGDKLLIPGTTTGDSAGPFNTLNEGVWNVLGVAADSLTLMRPIETGFVGVEEVVEITDDSQLKVYTLDNVQVGDTLDIVNGFSLVSRKSFVISAVTPDYVEFTSSEPLPEEEDIAMTSGYWSIYSSAKRFLHVEADQPALLAINGDTSQSGRLDPIVVGDPEQTAIYQKWGTVWSLSVTNRSLISTLHVTVITAE